MTSKYDPNQVIEAANAKRAEGGWEAAKFVFQSALFEWGDDAREDPSIQNNGAMATLWLAYAHFLTEAKQYKSATEAYEDAMKTCPVGAIFTEAARFAMERNRPKKAQDIYIQAVKTVTDEQDLELLWVDFLDMMREGNKPHLTMKELKAAIDQNNFNLDSDVTDGPEAKKAKAETSKTHVVTKESVEHGAKSIQIEELPEEIRAAWIGRDGNFPPQRPEPSLFSPAPPKLSDPTAKDILGLDLAIEVTERLLSTSGSLVLEVCRSLWSIQAFKEQEAKSKLDSIERKLLQEHEQLENDLEARLSVAGAATSAVQQMNRREMEEFRHSADQRRQVVLSEVAWELRKLLCGQQTLLEKLEVPGFLEGPTVDESMIQLQSQICKYLHSAFYIQSKIGSVSHGSMLQSQLKKLKSLSLSPKMGGGTSPVPPARLSPLPPAFGSGSGGPIGVHPIPQHGGDYSYLPTQQQTSLQPMLGPPNNFGYGAPVMMPQGGMAPLPPPPPPPPQLPNQPQFSNPQSQQHPPQYNGPPQQYPPYYR